MHLQLDQGEASDELHKKAWDSLTAANWTVSCPDGTDEFEAYQHAVRMRCMTCGNPLGADTVIMEDDRGLIGLWCDGECVQDMHAVTILTAIMDALQVKMGEKEADVHGDDTESD